MDKPLAATKGSRNAARDRCLLLLMFRHGLRVSKACALQLDQVDTESRAVHVARLKNGLSITPSHRDIRHTVIYTATNPARLRSFGGNSRTMIGLRSNQKLSADQIQTITIRVRRVYLTLIYITWLFEMPEIIFRLHFFENIYVIMYLVFLTLTYYGLRDRKYWVIPLVLINSVNLSFLLLLSFIEPANSIIGLFAKIGKVLLIYFFVYQINFLRRREVMHYFGDTGQVLF